jgi:hypothetical protein
MIAQGNPADLVNKASDFRVIEDDSRQEESLWILHYPTITLWL